MAPKSADKKPAAAKAVAPKGKSSKKGKKKSVESWKIYIYKVGRTATLAMLHCCAPARCFLRRAAPRRSWRAVWLPCFDFCLHCDTR